MATGSGEGIRLHDTLTGSLRLLETREPGVVRMYTCGPTVYNYTHIGHLRPALVGDVLVRHLRARGYVVRWITNFTDVDDKIIARANEEGVRPELVAERYIEDYLENMRALGIDGVTRYVRVTEHIPDILEMIEVLVAKGYAYAVEGDVYFSVEAKADYGKLAKRSLEDMQAGARVAVDPRKRHPMDFALWKAAKPGEPSWPSPWGPGRPGWHIECSAMSLKYLGDDFDIHGGGGDLIFPHHENELAQSEAYSGRPFVRIWLHNAMVEVDRAKMSKSLGNFVPLRELVGTHTPGAIRLFMLGTHYRKPLQYSGAALQEAVRAHGRLVAAREAWSARLGPARLPAEAAGGALAQEVARLTDRFERAMDDDLGTPEAIGCLFELVRAGNAALAAGEDGALALALGALERLGDRLGLWVGAGASRRPAPDEERTRALVELLLALRAEARAYRDWATADRIRDGLAAVGVTVEDTPEGTRWRWADGTGAAPGR